MVVMQHTPDFLCGDCRLSPPFFDRALSATAYTDVIKEAILQFKFHQKPALGKYLIQLLLSCLPDDIDWADYDAILPVPLHKIRQRQRGYNQSVILAKILAWRCNLKPMLANLIRIRATGVQWPLKERRQRKQNVKNAFRLCFPERVKGKNLILIDDIFTTGATVNECSRILKKAGAQSILVLTLSRAGLSDT
ncbi:phosphoribosyltransferase [candidate division KSB3 bacterium]|uniref:Phosphoribosyltransferase n=1 Tax=candidate division KSB3 bacterium TaxID=2044937 RepID=A0A2G6KBY3_9BACT|nr:MAG: phosphoribosyltransferase [candidate division KSB3 bacterium]